MIFYDKDNIVIRLANNNDIDNIIEFYSRNPYKVNVGDGTVMVTDQSFKDSIIECINSDKKENAILVMEKNNILIGYLTMHINNDKVVIDHVVISKSKRHNNYGSMLVFTALRIADNESRDVICSCLNPKNLFVKIGFRKLSDNVYFKKTKHVDKKMPKIFLSIEEYNAKKNIENFTIPGLLLSKKSDE